MQSPESGPNRATQATRRDIMIGGALATATMAGLPNLSRAAQPDSGHGPTENAIEGARDMSMVTTEDGTQIFYKDWGKGQPIVFSHGWPLSADDWDAQMLFFLNHGYRVVAHDRRGHGRSTQTSDGHDMDHYADDLAAVTAHLDLKNAIHVGHSTGGGEVVHYLARHGKSRVAKAAIISAVPPLMMKTEANPKGLPKEVFDGLQAQLAAKPVAVLLRFAGRAFLRLQPARREDD
jgi:pimeloyl-ACP methyl ester carboxylesterase